MIPAGFIYPWWCRISAMNSFSVWMMKWWFNKCHLAKPLWHTKDSAMISTTYSNKLSQPEMVKSIFIIFSMIQKFIWFICFSSQLQRNEASTPHKTIPTPESSRLEAGKDPLNWLKGKHLHFLVLTTNSPLHQWRRSSKKLPDSFETKSDGGGLQHFFIPKVGKVHPKSWGSAQETIHLKRPNGT